MAKGVRNGTICRVMEYTEEKLVKMLDKKAAVGYYNRPRPVKKPAKHFVILADGVAKRV